MGSGIYVTHVRYFCTLDETRAASSLKIDEEDKTPEEKSAHIFLSLYNTLTFFVLPRDMSILHLLY